MQVSVEHLAGVQFSIHARQHTILCDQPAENGGADEGMTPPELLLAALASCAGFYAAQYLKSRGLAGRGTRVKVEAEKAKAPARLDNFRIEVESPMELTAEQLAGMERSVRLCLIHNTLLGAPTIETVIRAPQAAGKQASSV